MPQVDWNASGLWSFGWALVLAGFASGALLGLGFHAEDFAGGYTSWRRRLTRLGHIACVALGVLAMLVALSPAAEATGTLASLCFGLWRLGAVAMPTVCFLSAWRKPLRHLFVLPVLALSLAAALTLALIQDGVPA
ncbi:MAG: hypothetical protein NTV21_10850 [Planctomycetota bacterium]|nr:hypothetical protein [Planctomycetota bacterium]